MWLKYRKKPVEIEAMQFTNENKADVWKEITTNKKQVFDMEGNPAIEITTLEGNMMLTIGNYLVKGIKGEFYPCNKDIFDASYDKL